MTEEEYFKQAGAVMNVKRKEPQEVVKKQSTKSKKQVEKVEQKQDIENIEDIVDDVTEEDIVFMEKTVVNEENNLEKTVVNEENNLEKTVAEPPPKKMPVYNVERTGKGKAAVTPQRKAKESKTLNQIDNEIQNDAIDNKKNMIKQMIKEGYDQLTRIQIEIDVLKRMYELYNRDIYNKQIKTYKDNLQNTINRIRILQEML